MYKTENANLLPFALQLTKLEKQQVFLFAKSF